MISCTFRFIRVFPCPRDRRKGIVVAGVMRFPCALGLAGAGLKKMEGDGVTPIGTYALRRLHYRAGKGQKPRSSLPMRRIGPQDWWSDDTEDRAYNRLVRLRKKPPVAKEGLWRKDALYDLVVEIGYNDRPALRGKGSGIFLHLARPGFAPSEGCVAVTREALLRLLPHMGPRTRIKIG